MKEFVHESVLLEESVEALAIHPDGDYVDATAGGGGHSFAIASRLKNGHLYCFDKDPDAIAAAGERLSAFPFVTLIPSDYREIRLQLRERNVSGIDGALFDLGVSSHQLDCAQRGFSYHNDAPLDMRMSQSGTTAADLVNTLSEEELSNIFFRYGEERYARSIARAIVAQRQEKRVTTTLQLAEIIKGAVPYKYRREEHPARRSFQALRIAVNEELDGLQEGLEAAFSLLRPGGRLCVITFHSLEDRIVKQMFADFAKGCICPPDFPVCVCGREPRGDLPFRKPIVPTKQEIEKNPRSRSAKLRVIQKR